MPSLPRVPPHRPSSGFTLLELMAVLAIVGVLLGMGTPLWRSTADRWAVRTVRDGTASALRRTRLEARRWGGARLEIDAGAGRLRVYRTSPDSVLWEDDRLAELRVDLTLPRNALRTTLHFDGLGLGVVASRTLVFRRGAAEARLVVSSRGRGTRR